MKRTQDNRFEWIKRHLLHRDAICLLSDLVPRHFENYVILPWVYGIIDNFPFDEYPKDSNTLEKLNQRHQIEKRFDLFLNTDVEHNYRPIAMREVADQFHVKYSADTVYYLDFTPGITHLLQPTIDLLKKVIELLSNQKPLNLCVVDNSRFECAIGDWKYKEENLIRNASAYIQFQKDTSWDSTSYLFPANSQWCICTLEDFQHFIICCNEVPYKLIKSLRGIETFDVSYDYKLLTNCA